MTIELIGIVAGILLLAVLVLQIVLIVRQSNHGSRLSAVQGALHEVKGQAEQVSRELSESRGRLSGIQAQQARLSETLSALNTAIPLQVSEGIRRIEEAATEKHASLRQELVGYLEKVASDLAGVRSQIPLLISDGITRLDEGATGRDSAMSKNLAERHEGLSRSIRELLDAGFRMTQDSLVTTRSELSNVLSGGIEANEKRMLELRGVIDTKLSELISRYTEGAQNLNETAQRTVTTVTDRLTELKNSVEKALKDEFGAVRSENAAKLEEMRKTVDDKLHETLEKRLGDSFKIVSDRLELVHRGLGEMQSLATGVGDLKKVLTNIKTRGTWGEVQLDALLEQILTPDQYGKNVECRPNSNSRVEFAIRLPGRGETAQVWLPIDAKFPMEDYQRLVEAQDRGDIAAIEEASKSLEQRVKLEARNIRERYVDPPNTTDFAILYLPTEGLYAEVLRRAGLTEWCQLECKVNLSGPTTLGALLNSLQMGFRTLSIEQRSSQVWALLGTIKSEFSKFGEALAHTKRKLEQAHNSLETTEKRNRVLTRKLKDVEVLPSSDTNLLGLEAATEGATDADASTTSDESSP